MSGGFKQSYTLCQMNEKLCQTKTGSDIFLVQYCSGLLSRWQCVQCNVCLNFGLSTLGDGMGSLNSLLG